MEFCNARFESIFCHIECCAQKYGQQQQKYYNKTSIPCPPLVGTWKMCMFSKYGEFSYTTDYHFPRTNQWEKESEAQKY